MIKQCDFKELAITPPTNNKWIIREFSDSELPINSLAETRILFFSAGQVFEKIQVGKAQQAIFQINYIWYKDKNSSVTSVYNWRRNIQNGVVLQNSWKDQTYRTLYFFTAPDGDLLTWLNTYAEKQ